MRSPNMAQIPDPIIGKLVFAIERALTYASRARKLKHKARTRILRLIEKAVRRHVEPVLIRVNYVLPTIIVERALNKDLAEEILKSIAAALNGKLKFDYDVSAPPTYTRAYKLIVSKVKFYIDVIWAEGKTMFVVY